MSFFQDIKDEFSMQRVLHGLSGNLKTAAKEQPLVYTMTEMGIPVNQQKTVLGKIGATFHNRNTNSSLVDYLDKNESFLQTLRNPLVTGSKDYDSFSKFKGTSIYNNFSGIDSLQNAISEIEDNHTYTMNEKARRVLSPIQKKEINLGSFEHSLMPSFTTPNIDIADIQFPQIGNRRAQNKNFGFRKNTKTLKILPNKDTITPTSLTSTQQKKEWLTKNDFDSSLEKIDSVFSSLSSGSPNKNKIKTKPLEKLNLEGITNDFFITRNKNLFEQDFEDLFKKSFYEKIADIPSYRTKKYQPYIEKAGNQALEHANKTGYIDWQKINNKKQVEDFAHNLAEKYTNGRATGWGILGDEQFKKGGIWEGLQPDAMQTLEDMANELNKEPKKYTPFPDTPDFLKDTPPSQSIKREPETKEQTQIPETLQDESKNILPSSTEQQIQQQEGNSEQRAQAQVDNLQTVEPISSDTKPSIPERLKGKKQKDFKPLNLKDLKEAGWKIRRSNHKEANDYFQQRKQLVNKDASGNIEEISETNNPINSENTAGNGAISQVDESEPPKSVKTQGSATTTQEAPQKHPIEEIFLKKKAEAEEQRNKASELTKKEYKAKISKLRDNGLDILKNKLKMRFNAGSGNVMTATQINELSDTIIGRMLTPSQRKKLTKNIKTTDEIYSAAALETSGNKSMQEVILEKKMQAIKAGKMDDDALKKGRQMLIDERERYIKGINKMSSADYVDRIVERKFGNKTTASGSSTAPGQSTVEAGSSKKGLLHGHGKAGKIFAGVSSLLVLGGIIGNQFAGGHQSNAQLYNPNPQPQYYS